MSTELVSVEQLNPVEIFKSGGIDTIIEQIRSKVANDVPDVSTLKGRKEIASNAHKVAKSKTLLDGLGKELADQLNAQLKPINSERKKARDQLDALKEEIRAPLTEWEEAEERRINNHTDAIAEIYQAGQAEGDSQYLKSKLEDLKNLEIGNNFEEFESNAHREKAGSIALLEKHIQTALKAEAEAAELERLRKEKAEQEERERLEAVKREAAEQARKEAEQRAEQERQQAEDEKREAIAAKERAEREAKEAAEKAERDRIAAAERAEREKAEAVAAEQRRVAEENERLKREAEAREQDKKHRAAINNQAAQAFIAGGFDETQAKDIVRLIAAGNVAHVGIRY